MQVKVNHQTLVLSDGATIAALLATLEISSPTGIAIAINDQVIKRDQWSSHLLCENDQILIIKATQGG